MAAPMARSLLRCIRSTKSFHRIFRNSSLSAAVSDRSIAIILQDESLCGSRITVNVSYDYGCFSTRWYRSSIVLLPVTLILQSQVKLM